MLHLASRASARTLLTRLALPLSVLLLAVGCGVAGSPTAAATVEGEAIPLSELEQTYDDYSQSPQIAQQLESDTTGETERTLQAQILTDLIRTEILRGAAEEFDLEWSQQEISDERAELAEQAGGEEALQQQLETVNISDEELEARLVDRVIQDKLGAELAEPVSDEQIRQTYDENASGEYGEQVEVRHILTETEEEAQAALERIQSGEDFATVAQEVSTDTGSAQNGGDLGLVARGRTVPEFEEAAFDAEVGELVGPVESQFGFHVLEVTDRVAGPEFADVEGDIRTQLEQTAGDEAFNAYIAEYIAGIDVEVNPRFGTWDATSFAVVPEQDALGTPDPEATAGAGAPDAGATPGAEPPAAPEATPAG